METGPGLSLKRRFLKERRHSLSGSSRTAGLVIGSSELDDVSSEVWN